MNALIAALDLAYGWFRKGAEFLQAPFLLAVRLYWGWQFWMSGTGKLADIPKVTEFFTSLGVPFPHFNAYFIAYLEAGGGILLILGLGARLISLPLVVDMIVAYITADREALGYIFSADSSDKFYKADPFTFLFAALIILFFGPGALSLDRIIQGVFTKRKKSGATFAA
jgi:putative oxidoreductase